MDLLFEGGGVKGIALVGAYSVLEDRFPLGKALSILRDLGIYEGKAFEEWMRGLLEAKGKRTFGDLVRREDVELRYRYKLQVIASDVTERRLLVLPRDALKLGIEDPDDIDLAHAVRMSIPSSSSR